jgi:hypothetical protein
MKKYVWLAFSFLTLIFIGSVLHAEVGVELNGNGQFGKLYIYTHTSASGTKEYWTRVTNAPPLLVLNEAGDIRGDRKPTYVIFHDSILDTDVPLVVWPAWNGSRYKITCSVWKNGFWSEPTLVDLGDSDVHQLDPCLSKGLDGKIRLAWWADEAIAKVYVSEFTGGDWTIPSLESDPSVITIHPSLAPREKSVESDYGASPGAPETAQEPTAGDNGTQGPGKSPQSGSPSGKSGSNLRARTVALTAAGGPDGGKCQEGCGPKGAGVQNAIPEYIDPILDDSLNPEQGWKNIGTIETGVPCPVYPEINLENGKIWDTWIHSSTLIGYSKYLGDISWSAMKFKPYKNQDDIARVKEEIRKEILSIPLRGTGF